MQYNTEIAETRLCYGDMQTGWTFRLPKEQRIILKTSIPTGPNEDPISVYLGSGKQVVYLDCSDTVVRMRPKERITFVEVTKAGGDNENDKPHVA